MPARDWRVQSSTVLHQASGGRFCHRQGCNSLHYKSINCKNDFHTIVLWYKIHNLSVALKLKHRQSGTHTFLYHLIYSKHCISRMEYQRTNV